MSMNWLEGLDDQTAEPGQPVFAGQKLVVVGGSSGMGRQAAADATLLVNAAGLFIPKPFVDHDGADYDSGGVMAGRN